MNQLLAQQNQLGTLSSGGTNFGLAQISGNTSNQFGNAYANLANQLSGQANTQNFGKAFEEKDFQNQLALMAEQAANQRRLAQHQADLYGGYSSPSFGQVLGQSFAGALPGMLLRGGIGGLNSFLGGGGGGYGYLGPGQGYGPLGQFGGGIGSGNVAAFGPSANFF